MLNRISVRSKEAARLLGLSYTCLYGMTKRGEVPAKQVKRPKRSFYIYALDDLRSWLKGGDSHGA
jgi:hypothetical protein